MSSNISQPPKKPQPHDIPYLPPELWNQILLSLDSTDLPYLWTTLRSVSHRFSQIVEKAVETHYLPHYTHISLIFPRRGPDMKLVHGSWVPLMTLKYAGLTPDRSRMILVTPETVKGKSDGEDVSMKELREARGMDEERMNGAEMSVAIGWKGALVPMSIEKDFRWDEACGVWRWKVDWKALVSGFLKAKKEHRDRLAGRRRLKR
ncbi:hypothetical protein CC78DRAFT_577176 [Lojkania enalia]|uniref:F-box domain-containing protein n=1 Tax=Lojkania enalia TaxID=147567 RepID=A0A9P4N2M7_9PLEO|nr:hypothetical protein CC78DRAFT_577176 [Didymosphaeria enalia]